jgi:hypothetical protein
MLPIRALRLQRQDAVTLNRSAFEEGELVYDATNGTIRLMDGNNLGGKQIATQPWTISAISTAVLASNSTLTTAVNLRAPIASPTFTGIVTSPSFVGPLTGNVTGNVTGTSGSTTGNAATATKLLATKTINSVAFDGSDNISVNTLVNGTKTITLNSSGNLVIPGASGGGLISSTGYNYLSTVGSLIIDGDQVALDYRGNNNLFVDEFGIEFYTNSTGTSGFNASISADNHWAFAPDGTTYVPGNITMPAGTVNASAVTTTNDITVGGNAVISTKPTLPTHATNKKYVDVKAIALAIAMS